MIAYTVQIGHRTVAVFMLKRLGQFMRLGPSVVPTAWRIPGKTIVCRLCGKLKNLDLISAKDISSNGSCNLAKGRQQTGKQVDRKMQSFFFYLPSI